MWELVEQEVVRESEGSKSRRLLSPFDWRDGERSGVHTVQDLRSPRGRWSQGGQSRQHWSHKGAQFLLLKLLRAERKGETLRTFPPSDLSQGLSLVEPT